ncbi:RluA family pseudouridine synthase [Sediminicoccus rosea]|jgi:23S rRNA pseudouridine955/2504/2580 synthase|uniref:Pseudouridine synthase n=1 Tax=Sediminicoccus rosea TaxID=1225128 RepID=A0ABZ0PL85_9PROT|nr:RluA family pseudouridine synthase [Sediminicoccus rosea]WPB86503.1 RluA family pseudouridine synthase [Sediminicoccus rosea]
MSITTLKVPPAEDDTRLDRWLKRRFPALTQGALQKMLRTGQIRVDGKRAEANTRLLAGQELRVPPMPTAPAPKAEPRPLSEAAVAEMHAMVLYRDDSLIVLNKPPGLAVQGGPGIKKHVDGMLEAFAEDGEKPRLVHRLDRDTSGVLVVARTVSAAAHLAKAFRGRDMEKTYWAVVVGEPQIALGRITMPLARLVGAQAAGRGGERTAPAEKGEAGMRAVTDYQVLEAAKHRAAFLELRPQTGRTHQLRVHCAEALKTPILGDGKYGGQAAHLEGLSGSLHLHARALRLPHPEGGWLEVMAAPPPHFEETMRFFGFDNPAARPPRRNR